MMELTPSARQQFDDYFRRLRHSLRGASPAEAEDVEQSVREHIEVALASSPGPVAADQLAEVLDRLGAPDRWVPPDERSMTQRVLERLRSGPEDWRLAYLSFGLFLLSLLLLPVGIGFFLLIASFLASRAYVDFMETREEPAGARRWLIYPPIGLFLLMATVAFIIGPAGPLAAWGIDDDGFLRVLEESGLRAPYHEVQFFAGAAASAFGAWWIVASILGMVLLPVVRFIFRPLMNRIRRTHFLGLTLVGVVVLSAGVALLWPWISRLRW
jgi:hypothetical protein